MKLFFNKIEYFSGFLSQNEKSAPMKKKLMSINNVIIRWTSFSELSSSPVTGIMIAHEILDFQMKTDLKTGLEKMWKWAQKQTPKQRFYWKEYELDKGIYSYWKK